MAACKKPMTMAAHGSRAWVRLFQNTNDVKKFFRRDDGDFLLREVFFVAGDEVVNLHCLGGIELNIILKFRHSGIKRLKNYLACQRDNYTIDFIGNNELMPKTLGISHQNLYFR
ncbi:MAG: hypothetical protein ACRENG_33070 [bacterium]